jgi:hypothetical protein
LGFGSKPDGAKYLTTVNIGQRLRFAPNFFDNVPMDITFYSADFKTQTYKIELGKERQQMVLATDFIPVYVAIDINRKISDAITDASFMIKNKGSLDFENAMMTIEVTECPDSSFVRVEHNWVGADAYFGDGNLPFLSRERYWNVDGVWNENFKADATIEYFGRETGTNYLLGYLDVDLIRGTEENLVLMYRPNATATWVLCENYTWNMGSKFDKRGSFTIHNVRKGQYAFGINEAERLSIPKEITVSDKYISVFPNPTSETLNIEVEGGEGKTVEITDSSGRIVRIIKVNSKTFAKSINVTDWAKGVYYIGIIIDDKPYQPKRVLVR